MNDETIKIKPHPIITEVKFPKTNLITLDTTTFDYESATECFTAVRNAMGLYEPMEVVMYEDTDGTDNKGKPIERISYSCPRCGKGYLLPYAYECPECKQRLKW